MGRRKYIFMQLFLAAGSRKEAKEEVELLERLKKDGFAEVHGKEANSVFVVIDVDEQKFYFTGPFPTAYRFIYHNESPLRCSDVLENYERLVVGKDEYLASILYARRHKRRVPGKKILDEATFNTTQISIVIKERNEKVTVDRRKSILGFLELLKERGYETVVSSLKTFDSKTSKFKTEKEGSGKGNAIFDPFSVEFLRNIDSQKEYGPINILLDIDEKLIDCSYDDFDESCMSVRPMKLYTFLRHHDEILDGQASIDKLKEYYLENQ